MLRLFLLLFFSTNITLSAQTFTQTGEASYYANTFNGRLTASGSVFSNDKLTAAHKELPFGTKVKVTNISNHKSVTVTITDRGPFIKGRIIDLSQKAANKLGFLNQGATRVQIEVINERLSKYPMQPLQPLKLEEFARVHITTSTTRELIKCNSPL